METIIVVTDPDDWPFDVEGVQVVSSRSYVTDPSYAARRGLRVFNLSRSYRYQSMGYYVSLLAAARGHRPVPSVSTIQEMKAQEIVRIRSDELGRLVQSSLRHIQRSEFVLSVYFGKNLAKRYDRLSMHLFKLFGVPLLRVTFRRSADDGQWQLRRLAPIAADAIPASHHRFVLEVVKLYFRQRRAPLARRNVAPYDLAILRDPEEAEPPSDERALQLFCKAAASLGMNPSFVDQEDYATLAQYDALFIRETTAVNHHTFRFARRAQAEGLVVVDDPESILRCTNKVYLAELMERRGIPTPATLVVHKDNVDRVAQSLGFPCVLKQPDSAFSQGVVKVEDEAGLVGVVEKLFTKSELVIAQKFTPTPFDWRVGVFDGVPLWVCKYHMAQRHWQIIKSTSTGLRRSGRVEALAVEAVPRRILRAALKATRAIGDGLYGVDLKEIGGRAYVIEVNDNPSMDAGYEDRLLGKELYLSIMRVFRRRLDKLHGTGAGT